MADSTSFFTDGAAYERLMGRWSRAVGEVYLDWLSLPDGLRWLDVGCGTGAFTELVLDRCAPSEISAIDPSEDQVAYAKSRTAAGRVDFRIGDAQSLPFADDEFDVATMALAINFIPDSAKAVAEMKRVVRAGGTVATYIWDMTGKGYTQQPLLDALEELDIELPKVRPEITRRDVLNELFSTAGLDDVSVRSIDIQLTFENFEDFWASNTGFANPYVQLISDLPAADLELFKASLQDKLPADGSGRIAHPARANAVKGRVPM